MTCPTCGTELVQRNRAGLLVAAAVMLVAAGIAIFLYPILWIIAALFLVIALYLITWSTAGKGLWCRRCKNFPVNRPPRGDSI
jgi:preprotein translocase subunit SecG